jgi:hypothetical protein
MIEIIGNHYSWSLFRLTNQLLITSTTYSYTWYGLYIGMQPIFSYTGRIFILLNCSTALRFSDQGAACREEHMNFAHVSACLTTDNVRNEGRVVTIHRSQVLKMLSLYTQIFFAINCFVKKKQVQQSFLHLQHTRHRLSLDGFSSYVAVLALDFDTPVSWARRFSDFLGACSSLAPVI